MIARGSFARNIKRRLWYSFVDKYVENVCNGQERREECGNKHDATSIFRVHQQK